MRYWKENKDPTRHRDWMSTSAVGGVPVGAPEDGLIESWQYFVQVSGFTFEFASVEQVRVCLTYFASKTHPSTREPNDGLEHYWQAWYMRLPKGLTKEPKRHKIEAALIAALQAFEDSTSGHS